MTERKRIPWSRQTIQGMVSQPLGYLRTDPDNVDYRLHREAHAKGKGKRMYRGEISYFGGYRTFFAITPEGLAANWEMLYINRIRLGEHGERFEQEIRNSPLPGGTKKNLIENMRNRHAGNNKRTR